mgnify:CR=1 FL=1
MAENEGEGRKLTIDAFLASESVKDALGPLLERISTAKFAVIIFGESEATHLSYSNLKVIEVLGVLEMAKSLIMMKEVK